MMDRKKNIPLFLMTIVQGFKDASFYGRESNIEQ